jgi:hypothetical protein
VRRAHSETEDGQVALVAVRKAQPTQLIKRFFFANFASSRLCVEKSMLARLRAISGLRVNLRMSTDL